MRLSVFRGLFIIAYKGLCVAHGMCCTLCALSTTSISVSVDIWVISGQLPFATQHHFRYRPCVSHGKAKLMMKLHLSEWKYVFIIQIYMANKHVRLESKIWIFIPIYVNYICDGGYIGQIYIHHIK
jgi:hypothetical protein